MHGRQNPRSVTSKVRDNLPSDKFIIIDGAHEGLSTKKTLMRIRKEINKRV